MHERMPARKSPCRDNPLAVRSSIRLFGPLLHPLVRSAAPRARVTHDSNSLRTPRHCASAERDKLSAKTVPKPCQRRRSPRVQRVGRETQRAKRLFFQRAAVILARGNAHMIKQAMSGLPRIGRNRACSLRGKAVVRAGHGGRTRAVVCLVVVCRVALVVVQSKEINSKLGVRSPKKFGTLAQLARNSQLLRSRLRK
jgi:hypothetical protein